MQNYSGLSGLGSALYDNLSEGRTETVVTVQPQFADKMDSFLLELKTVRLEAVTRGQKDCVFAPFYDYMVSAYLQSGSIHMEDYALLKNREQMLWQFLYGSIMDIPVRVLIYEMHQCRDEGILAGQDSAAQYAYYCGKMLSDRNYIWNLCSTYREMTRLLFVKLTDGAKYLLELLAHITENHAGIVRDICGGKEFHCLSELRISGSDSHNHGRKVAECTLDNGIKLVYKPHGMKKEKEYHELYLHFCQSVGAHMDTYIAMDCESYGIAEYLDGAVCGTESQVQDYFKCMGVHLFLCYLLHAGDIHQENIVAAAGLPILVDAETIPGIQIDVAIKSAKDKVNEKNSWNVLRTGILPYPVWRSSHKGVVLGALHTDRDVYSTIKMPMVKKQKTAEMYIDYEYIKIKFKNSIPVYKGKRVEPSKYAKWICKGFEAAYRLYLSEQDSIEKMLEVFWRCDTRYLVRHTQQYSMYLSSSLHPVFMKNTAARMLMLQVLQKNEDDADVIKEEISSLMDMDIPLLSCKSTQYMERYCNSACSTHRKMIKKFGIKDMRQQLGFIKLSMELADLDRMQNQYFGSLAVKRINIYRMDAGQLRIQADEALKKLVSILKAKAVIYENDICWDSLKLEGENLWSMQPLEINLYDGICGVAVFVTLLYKTGYLNGANIYELIVNKLCGYVNGEEFQKETRMGLFVGAGSLLYTFLILYAIEPHEAYLECARKAVRQIENNYQSDTDYDLLSGTAGAIVALVRYYEMSGDVSGLTLAARMGDSLWGQSVQQRKGAGFPNKQCSVPLGGMAHGNSGFILAYSYLLKHTRDKKYREIIDSLLEYENAAYSEVHGNWRDLRYAGMETFANAWCHGAPGILLSRLVLKQLDEYRDSPVVAHDIGCASKALFDQSYRKGLCLCHGMAGNYMIMEAYRQLYDLSGEQEAIIEGIKTMIVRRVRAGKMLPQDKYMMGLMTGISGIGCVLCYILADR